MMTTLPAAPLIRRAGPSVSAAALALGVDRRTVHRWARDGLPVARADELAASIGCHELELWTTSELSTALAADSARRARRIANIGPAAERVWLSAYLGKHPDELDLPADLALLPPSVARRYAERRARRDATTETETETETGRDASRATPNTARPAGPSA